MKQTQSQQGFTLIELIVVIVILGILAATALPKFIDLRSDAARAATDGVAGALNSAFAINYGGCLVIGPTATNTAKCIRISAAEQACNAAAITGSVGGIMQGGLTDTKKYTMSTHTINCSGSHAGETLGCTLSGENSTTANVTLICTG